MLTVVASGIGHGGSLNGVLVLVLAVSVVVAALVVLVMER